MIQGADFVSVPTRDTAPAQEFYDETVGLADPDGNGIVLHRRIA